MKKILTLLCVLLVAGCSLLDDIDTEDANTQLALKIVVAEAIYQDDSVGTESVCRRAARTLRIVDDARLVLDSKTLSLSELDSWIKIRLYDENVNPVTAEAITDLIDRVIRTQAQKAIESPEYSTIRASLVDIADAVRQVAESAICDEGKND